MLKNGIDNTTKTIIINLMSVNNTNKKTLTNNPRDANKNMKEKHAVKYVAVKAKKTPPPNARNRHRPKASYLYS